MNADVVFEVTQDEDGGYVAECLTQPIVTQGDTWEELRRNVQEAVSAYFFDREVPKTVRIRLIRDELLAVG
jgi:predicted RNase H-like HicB family nuclease